MTGPGRTRRGLPISLRLTLVFTVLLLGSLAIVATVAYLQLGRDLRTSLDSAVLAGTDEVESRLPQATRVDARTTGDVASTVVDSQALDARGRVRSASTPALEGRSLLTDEQFRDVVAGSPRFGDSDRTGDPMRVHAVRVQGVPGVRVLVVATELDQVEESREAYLSLVFPLGLMAACLAGVSGWLVSRRALRPVARMTSEAADIGAGDLTRRLAIGGTEDELSRLGVTLNAMLERLHDAVRRERDFTADASHELRTPLAILRAELEMTLQRTDDPESRASLTSALEECERLRGLTEDLLLIARAEGTRLDTRAPTDLGDLTDTVLFRFRALAEQKGVTLTRRGDAVIDADPRALERALSNLVDNAMRHTQPGGHIEVTIEPGAGLSGSPLLLWRVADDGPGVRAEDRERLLQRFARADPARTTGGAGLGLAIVEAVTRSHGGTVSLDRSPGGGLRATLAFTAPTEEG
ncbi:MAG: HAMP domain-containing protein [Nocardioidaceae bacterium]|nr:HAMP domain-containing protein [Nocardioidaceae bacterium]NUS50916.1 HAMP domain-containing protein [Nocardioidaceae bacterium]